MRRKDREITDTADILYILDTAKVLHLAMYDGEYPYVIPLHYGYEYNGGRLTFYTHGASEGHKLDLIRSNPNVCIEAECDVVPVSGGEIPCGYGSEFASAVGRGKACIVTDEQEKIKGLKLLMLNQTGRDFEIDGRMAASVSVIRLDISGFTAKARRKPQ